MPSKSALIRMDERLGKVPDSTIARTYGVTRALVAAVRAKMGVEAYNVTRERRKGLYASVPASHAKYVKSLGSPSHVITSMIRFYYEQHQEEE